MNPHYSCRRVIGAALVSAFAGCGGGGGSDGSGAGGSTTYPASGAYGWVLKASGATDALKYGLSFVHPGNPSTEYVIEVAREVVSDARLVSSGTVDAAQLRSTANQPFALVYIVGGDVRSVPMQADGSAPRSRLQRAQSTSACSFVIEANDYAAPWNSRYIVSTAGADGQCKTADDGRAEVRLSASGTLGYTPLSGELPLGVVRDPVTLAPRGWIYPRSVVLWDATPVIPTRTAPSAPITGVLASSHNAALVADGARLAVFNFTAGAAITEAVLDPVITAGGTWQSIGFDADNFYVYTNTGTNPSNSNWIVLKVTRTNPTASVLASGSGLADASMGRDMLYVSAFGQADNQLIRVVKASGTQVQTSYALSTKPFMLTGADGVHLRWTVTDGSAPTASYKIEMVDEIDAILSTVAGGFPLGMAEAGLHDFNASESRTRFLIAANYGSLSFSDALLIDYDSATRTPPTTLGTLPGATAFGSDAVFASVNGGPGAAGLGFAARSSGGSVQEAGAKVFSFELGVANSLKFTTAQK